MAKIKVTDNGNVKVTMSKKQWAVLMAICDYVRLGNSNQAVTEISNLLIDAEGFNWDYIVEDNTKVSFTVDPEDGFIIELADE